MVPQQFIRQLYLDRQVKQPIYFHQECHIQVNRTFVDLINELIVFLFVVAVVGPAIDTATGLQLQPAAAYTALPTQYPIYTPTTIYSHFPTTTLIPGPLASPGKEGS